MRNDLSSIKQVAVVGLGSISTRHRKNLKALYPGVSVIGVSSSGRKQLENLSDLDIVVPSVELLLKRQLDFAIIASPSSSHLAHATPLIEHGIPVLIEKPVTAYATSASALCTLIQKRSVPAAVAYCLRYREALKVVKRVVDSRDLGEILNVYVDVGQYLPDWRPKVDFRNSVSARSELGGGALLELSHEIDFVQYLLGPLKAVSALLKSSKHFNLDVEDTADFVCETDQGAVVSFHLDFLKRPAMRVCRIAGDRGTLEWNVNKNTVSLNGSADTTLLYENPNHDPNTMYLDMIEDFVRLIRSEPNNCVSVEEASTTVELIDAVKSIGIKSGILR